ncbi:MAG: hypothetical protein WCW44_03770 [archaeon]
MFSGQTEDCIEIINNATKDAPSGENLTVANLAELCKIYSQFQFRKLVEEKFLNSRGLKFKQFYSKGCPLPIELFKDLDERIKLFQLNFEEMVSLIIAGIDSSGTHIFEVTGNGQLTAKDYLGFSIIGEGQRLSFPEITKNKYSTSASLGEVLFRVFNAKKISERVSSVGKETDLGVIALTRNAGKEVTGKEVPEVDVEVHLITEEFKAEIEKAIISLKEIETNYIHAVSDNIDGAMYRPQPAVNQK